MKKIILSMLAVLILLPAAVRAEGEATAKPHWSVEVKGGRFMPAIEDWSRYFGSTYMPEFGGSVAYKIIRQIDLGIGAGVMRDRGQATAPLHGTLAGEVTYELLPVNAFILARGVVSERQWLVPYAGGGFTRMFYRQRIKDQDTVRGAANGFHFRGGLQLLLDGIDRGAADSLELGFGVLHTYFFIEGEYSRAFVEENVSLGGRAYMAGLLFEF